MRLAAHQRRIQAREPAAEDDGDTHPPSSFRSPAAKYPSPSSSARNGPTHWYAAVEASTVTIDSVRPVQWSSETIVCDAEIVPADEQASGATGYRIVLTADEREFVYHTDFDRIIPCSGT